MPGMNSGLNTSNPTLVTAFRNALLHQGIIVFLIFAVLAVAWVAVREWLRSSETAVTRAAAGSPGGPAKACQPPGPACRPQRVAGGRRAEPRGQTRPEPAWRQLLRIGLGVLWILDGLPQAQPAMAVGLAAQVIEPMAASSPGWVQHVVNWAGTTWSYHPI